MKRNEPGLGTFRTLPNGLIEHRRGLGIDAEGRPIRPSVYGKSKRVCVDKMAAKIAELAKTGSIRVSDDLTIAGWLSAWLARREREVARGTLAQSTFELYEGMARLHIVPHLGAVRLDKLTIRQAGAWLADLEQAEVGGRTRQYARQVLGTALNDAVRAEHIDRNPIALVQAPRHRRADFDVWDVEEALAFLRSAESDRFYALWVLSLTTGARPSELLGLRPQDLVGSSLTLTQQLVRRSKTRGRTKTTTSRRTLSLTPLAVEALRAHREGILAAGLRASPWLFPATNGGPMNYRNLIMRHYEPTVQRATVGGKPLRRVRPYDLRHTYATLALAAGVPLHVVSRSLGHSSAAFTAATYAHMTKSLEKAHVARVQGIFGHVAPRPARGLAAARLARSRRGSTPSRTPSRA